MSNKPSKPRKKFRAKLRMHHGKRAEIHASWRFWNDEQLLGRNKEVWATAESLKPNDHTMQDFADGSPRAKEIVHSYRLVVPVRTMTALDMAIIQDCSGICITRTKFNP